MVQMHTLVKIAAIGGVATVTMGMAFRYKVNQRVSQTEFYTDALATLRAHAGAVQLLGEPITDMMMDVGDETLNYTKSLEAQYEVPVKGPKQRGTMYFWAERKSEIENWAVNRIELGLKNEPSRRLLVKKVES